MHFHPSLFHPSLVGGNTNPSFLGLGPAWSNELSGVQNTQIYLNKFMRIAALIDTTTHCNTLQHTATHCNTLQHTAHTRVKRGANHTNLSE